MGGASATGYQRWGGQTVVGASPVAAARTSASVVPASASASSKDWAGLRAATVVPVARSRSAIRAVTHVLPISVAVPATTTTRSGRARLTG